MRLTLNTFRRATPMRVLLAGTVMAALGLSVLMASSASLHRALHPDAGDPSHHCVATLLARDHVLPVEGQPVSVEPVLGLVFAVVVAPPAAFVPAEFLASPSRAPPALS